MKQCKQNELRFHLAVYRGHKHFLKSRINILIVTKFKTKLLAISITLLSVIINERKASCVLERRILEVMRKQ